MEQREKVGKIATDLLQKQHLDTHTAADQGIEMTKSFMDEIWACINHNAALGSCKRAGSCECMKKYKTITPSGMIKDDFYITVLTKKERLLRNVIRNYFLPRLSCPTPTYDQTVFKYHASDQRLEYLWTVPSVETCTKLRSMPLDLPKEEQELLRFVFDFHDGTLLNKAKVLNGEIK